MDEVGLLRKWIEALVAGLDNEVDETTRAQVMKTCGRACALHFGSIEQARTSQCATGTVDEWLDRLNQQEGFWCGKWVRDGGSIHSVCEACGCPLVRTGLVTPSPTFCNCSRGWVEAVFEAVLGRPVEVELKQAIGRGDSACKFVVHLDERMEMR